MPVRNKDVDKLFTKVDRPKLRLVGGWDDIVTDDLAITDESLGTPDTQDATKVISEPINTLQKVAKQAEGLEAYRNTGSGRVLNTKPRTAAEVRRNIQSLITRTDQLQDNYTQRHVSVSNITDPFAKTQNKPQRKSRRSFESVAATNRKIKTSDKARQQRAKLEALLEATRQQNAAKIAAENMSSALAAGTAKSSQSSKSSMSLRSLAQPSRVSAHQKPASVQSKQTQSAQTNPPHPNLPIGQPITSPTDPRWVLAVHASQSMEGSMLPPEKRDRIIDMGKKLGLTAFDANLIIAILQDQARRGYLPDQCPAAGEPQLAMIALPKTRTGSAGSGDSLMSSVKGASLAYRVSATVAAVIAVELLVLSFLLAQ